MPLTQKKLDHFFLACILFITGMVYLVHAIYFQSSFEGGDGLRHYLISRYSWQHPLLFTDLWGKPFFTLVSSPFSQFGLIGTKIFNIICSLLTFYILYRIACMMEMANALLVPLFAGFASLYVFGVNS